MFLFMDLLLVRHGQPDWAPDRLVRNDPGLTELGQAQAARVAHRLASLERVDELWVSSMTRAVQTADLITTDLDHGREVYDWLQEINNPPEWEGAPVEEIERHFEEANTRSMEEMWEGLPGGESFRAFHERVVGGLAKTLDSHGIHPMDPEHRHLWTVDDSDRRVIIVAHAGTNAVILGHLLGLDPVPWEWERFRQPHTGVSRLTMTRISTGWAFSLRQLGNVAHLHPGMVTV
ncbi:MAG: histidine phosphatase family protein [Acidimicrobiia bacterium]|jgi:probable phosphoglycerate mutase